MSQSSKNLRLSFAAWQELRIVKFRLKQANTYSDVLEIVMNEHKGHGSLSDDVRAKSPTDRGDTNGETSFDKADKTIVVSKKIHNDLLDLKTEYMIAKGFTSRGPNAVSISDILLDLFRKFREKRGLSL